MKRALSLLLAVIVSLSAFPLFASAYPGTGDGSESYIAWSGSIASGFAGGKGTESEPYIIKTAAELAYLAKAVNNAPSDSDLYTDGNYYVLGADIELSEAEWVPIGVNNVFSGNFSGEGFRISGMKVTAKAHYTGLFGNVRNSNISKLYIKNAVVSNSGAQDVPSVGAFAGNAINSEFESVYVSGSVSCTGGEIYVGGLFGTVSGCDISDCAFDGTVSGKASQIGFVGGLSGSTNKSLIQNCYSAGSVSAIGDNADVYAGGIVGNYNLLDEDMFDNKRIEKCFSAAAVTSEIINFTPDGITSEPTHFNGAIVGGSIELKYIKDCYYSDTALKNYNFGSEIAGAHTTEDNFKNADWLIENLNFSFSSRWVMLSGNSLPLLKKIKLCGYNDEHTESEEWTEVTPATCTAGGKKAKLCVYCQTVMSEETIQPLGHNYSEEWTVDTPPTATADGSKSHHCVRCGQKDAATVTAIPKLQLSLNATKLNLNKGRNFYLFAETNSSDEFVWWSSNPAIVSAEPTADECKVTAKARGSAVVYCRGKKSGIVVNCQITVKVPATSVKFAKPNYRVNKGSTAALSLSVKPSDTTDTAVYSSGNTKVATVSSKGVVTAKAWGKTTITAKVGNVKTTCTVTVLVPVKTIKVKKTSKIINKGDKYTLGYTVSPASTTDNIVFTSSNSKIASVNKTTGVITGRKKGTCYIYVRADSGKKAKCKITVKNLKISATKKTVEKKDKFTLSVTGGKVKKWRSGNKSVATVSSKGKVVAKKAGKAIITATDKDGVAVSCTVLVADYSITNLKKTKMSVYYMTDTPSFTGVAGAKCISYRHISDETDEYKYLNSSAKLTKYVNKLKAKGYTFKDDSNAISTKYDVYNKRGEKALIILAIGGSITITALY